MARREQQTTPSAISFIEKSSVWLKSKSTAKKAKIERVKK
jgi:hypothetical protein